MKSFILSLAMILVTAVSAFATPPTINIIGDITTNTTWVKTKIYNLQTGFHYVKNNATLTIEAGTLIKSNGGTIVVTRGAKMIAIGTVLSPIIFTSSKAAGSRVAGDWGGIVLLGKAKINDATGERLVEGGLDATLGLYGGTDDADNSGQLSYVRIEYAGIFYIANNEVNSLTMGGVGTGTIIDHIQVTRANDDAFEWFGGSVNAKYLVADATLDDDFDTDFGFTGKVQFGLVRRNPTVADVSRSNMFESDNDNTGSLNIPFTNAKFSNITALGPIQATMPNTVSSLYGRALHAKRSTRQDVYNSVITGYPVGFMIDGVNCVSAANAGELQFKNNILAGITGLKIDTVAAGAGAAFDSVAFAATVTYNANALFPAYVAPYAAAPNFRVAATSPVLAGSNFTGLDPFFTPTTYVGAFSTGTPWTDCWTEWDAQNANYASFVNYLKEVSIVPNGGTTTTGTVLTVTAPTGSIYKWYRNNVAIAGASASTYTAALAGTYYCRVTTPRKCVLKSKVVTVAAGLVISTEEVVNVSDFDVFPNPATDNTNIFFTGVKEGAATVTVADALGRVVFTQSIAATEGDNNVSFDAATFARGMYTITLRSGAQTLATRLILE